MKKNGTGWERDRRNHFDDIVVNYDKIRPEYPDKLFEVVIEYCGYGENKRAVEIGAGTGKATTPSDSLEPGFRRARVFRLNKISSLVHNNTGKWYNNGIYSGIM